MLPIRRSVLPSPLTSATDTDQVVAGASLTTKACWGAKEGMVAPGTAMFSNTDTVLACLPLSEAWRPAATRSGLPSPLTSPTPREVGQRGMGKVCGGARETAVAPGAVGCSSTDTEM